MKKALIVAGVFISFVIIGLLISFNTREKGEIVVGAVGGGKENFLADQEFNSILSEKYNIKLKVDDWSNHRLVKDELLGKHGNGREYAYDFTFFSDERFYTYYKKPAGEDEAPRKKIEKGGILLSTPIVVYSWAEVCDVLMQQGIVTERNGVYYISDMNKLLSYVTEGKEWKDIGLDDTFGKINIMSTDPVTSSPGATYYGLLAVIIQNGFIDETNVNQVLPKLNTFYRLSGFMNDTPADLFDLYMRVGRGGYPLVVDYEKSIIDFANNNPEAYQQVKDKVRILYPEPTVWNSHCMITFNDKGSTLYAAFNDPQIRDIAWTKYGFRLGLTGSGYQYDAIEVDGIPAEIISVAPGLKKEMYDKITEALKQQEPTIRKTWNQRENNVQ